MKQYILCIYLLVDLTVCMIQYSQFKQTTNPTKKLSIYKGKNVFFCFYLYLIDFGNY